MNTVTLTPCLRRIADAVVHPDDRAVARAIKPGETLPHERLLRRVAETLATEESAAGAWSLDIGIWGPGALSIEAEIRIERAIGRLLEVAPPAPEAAYESTWTPRATGRRMTAALVSLFRAREHSPCRAPRV